MERLLNVKLVDPARMTTWVSANVFAIRYIAGGRFAHPIAVPVGHTQQMDQQHNSTPGGAGKHPSQRAAVQTGT